MISKIKNELQWMMEIDDIIGVLLFGSQVEGTASRDSDLDICVVAPSVKTTSQKAELLGEIWQNITKSGYDVWLFEELPLYMQIEVILNHVVIFCDDIPALYEYFYFFRKMWRSQCRRQSLRFESTAK